MTFYSKYQLNPIVKECYGLAQGSHSDHKGIRAKAQEKSGYGEESDTQTLSMLRHAVAIYLLQCRIIYFFLTIKELGKGIHHQIIKQKRTA